MGLFFIPFAAWFVGCGLVDEVAVCRMQIPITPLDDGWVMKGTTTLPTLLKMVKCLYVIFITYVITQTSLEKVVSF